MSNNKTDILPDTTAAGAGDRGESTALMEPLLISEGSRHRTALTDLALELTGRATGFRSSLPVGFLTSLAHLIRSMNCYYSNLIEGHDTHPVDIERALRDDYSLDPQKRDLQREAKAHIEVQQWIDEGGLRGRATAIDGLLELHRRFGELLPDDLLWTEDRKTGEQVRVVPGSLREREVLVGRHVPVSPGALPRFLKRFEAAYSNIGKTDTILAAAASHHRLLWIHPFLDGNGRVARLMSHAMLLETLNTGGVWSVARGLARNEGRYKQFLAACDQPRRNDLDGRGNLSEEKLAKFTGFFLEICIDQVNFMEELMQPDRLHDRILIWAEEETRSGILPRKSGTILEALLYRGALPRREVPGLLGVSERQARRVISALIEQEVLISESSRAPLRLAFPARLAHQWLPGLFPER